MNQKFPDYSVIDALADEAGGYFAIPCEEDIRYSGDYIIPLFEAICYFYVQFCTGIVLNAEIYITFLTESHVGSFSYIIGGLQE